MVKIGWQVHHVPAEMRDPASPLPFVVDLPDGWSGWLRDADVTPGTPFLLSPMFEYDVALNEFFRSVEMVGSSRNTQSGYARDIAAFLNFLWSARGGLSWRDATETDHTAYLVWRRHDPGGPRVEAATWDREVAAVNRFYRWQVRAGNVRVNPIPQRDRRPAPAESGHRGGAGGGETPATYSHGASREKIEWFPVESYRRWRDIGMRGYTADGLPDPGFRGRWAGRNATFCDKRAELRLMQHCATA